MAIFVSGAIYLDYKSMLQWEQVPNQHLIMDETLGQLHQQMHQLAKQEMLLHKNIHDMKIKIFEMHKLVNLKEAQQHLFIFGYEYIVYGLLWAGFLSLFYYGYLKL